MAEEGLVLNLSSEGQGILRDNHLVVFVPFTAPGDRVRYETVHRKKNFSQGKLLQVLQPSPVRTTPLCRYFGHCGGCQLQHITYEAQLETKRHLIEDAFKRIGKFRDISVQPVEPAKINWAYRRHVTLKIKAEEKTLSAGYVAMDNLSILRIEHCPIFISENNPAIQEVQDLLKHFSAKNFSEGSAVLFKTSSDQYILSLYFKSSVNFPPDLIDNFLKNSKWIGVILQIQEQKMTWGTTTALMQIEGMSFICSPEVFTQNHPEQSLKIYQKISEIAAQSPGSKIFDLYCGVGISSALLAKQGHHVVGVEYNPLSIKFAKENAQINGLATCRFLQGDVEQVLKNHLKKENADLILVNPPRTGLAPQVVVEILKRNPKEILYVSCMPSTLARDLNLFCAQGYKISHIQPYDMFPQTYHVETLVCLVK